MDKAVIIFVKNPAKGRVKTRLAASIGEEEALQVYLGLLDHTRDALKHVDADFHLYYSSFIDFEDEWDNKQFKKSLQFPGDLGQRMFHAFEEVLEHSGQAVIIGSDCPEINSDIINEALSALGSSDYVVGPSHDGGYYLLGMKKAESSIFEDINWSTDTVFDATLKSIEKLNASVQIMKTLYDLDDADDLERFPEFKV